MVQSGGFDEHAMGAARLAEGTTTAASRPPKSAAIDHRFRRQRVWRALLMSLLAVVFIVVVCRGWQHWQARSAWSSPLRVVGPSMSPTLWESSRQIQCPDCGYQCRIHDELTSSPREDDGSGKLCFRCGKRNAQITAESQAADAIQIDFNAYRSSFWNTTALSAPQRYDLVAIQKTNGAWEVKRVVALPGETMAINRRGQVEINGVRCEPSLETLWHHRVVVYDDADRSDHQSRWIDDPISSWTIYHHIDIYNSNRPAPIRDDHPANINERRQLERIEELWLALTFTTSSTNELEVAFLVEQETDAPKVLYGVVSLTSGQHSLRLTNYAGRIWLLSASSPDSEPSSIRQNGTYHQDGLGVIDELPSLSPAQPVAYRFRSMPEVVISERWLGRQQRFDPPYADREFWRSGMIVPTDHYVVLGDNPARSHDSRQDRSAIPKNRILGRVRRVEASVGQNEERRDGASPLGIGIAVPR
jgi:hypothetical protein